MNPIKKKSRHRTGINITPLLDVLLVLLLLFIVITPIVTSDIDVDLPESSIASKSSEKSDPIIITISKEEKFFIGDKEMPLDLIIKNLSEIPDKNLRIYIKGDKNINFGSVIELMSLINKSGFKHVSLVTAIK